VTSSSAPPRSRRGVRAAAIAAVAAVLAALVVSSLPPEAGARTEVAVSIDPVMTRGRANAPVTIIEFSDYQ
jgi:protein-disulfide isomerase